MKTKDVVRYFGSKVEAARALGITRQAITYWGVDVPDLRAFQIEIVTKGKLKAGKQMRKK